MPATVAKIDGYRVKHSGKISAKKTTYKKAMLQKRLLDAVRHGWKPTRRKTKRRVARPGR